MSPRFWLAAYLLAVVAVSFLHEPLWLAIILLAVLLAAGRLAPRLLWRALLAVLLVNLMVSGGYVALSLWQGNPWALTVIRLNLRVLLLTVLTLWLAARIDLVRALSVGPASRFLAVVAINQILLMRRLVQDYRHAFRSRSVQPPRLRDHYRSAARQGVVLMDKAQAQAESLSQGMRSRGVFDDRP
ncbi:MAG: hypothetical protein JJU06_17445 [Ectothiorhodospiraceae bacterium]|nr:hypothetical protein [Ectothiorhodospiraceae bacterium]MCH8502689.1 hypothetical protein [Ectothiorhodospiraceae bacterium]